jgi:hypothetical protein
VKGKSPEQDVKFIAPETRIGREWRDGLQILAGIIARRHLERRRASQTQPPTYVRLIAPQGTGAEKAGR